MLTVLANDIRTSAEAAEALNHRTSSVCEIDVDEVRIDRRFQRGLREPAVRKIKAEYHAKGIGLILVAGVPPEQLGDVRLACIDGQTRVVAIRELKREITEGSRQIEGFTSKVMAETFAELSVAEAALLFRLRNQHPAMPVLDRNRIRVFEGDPTMLEVVRQSQDAGYVPFDDDPEQVTMPFVPTAAMIVNWEHKNGHMPNLLTRTLSIQARAFETPEGLFGTLDPVVLKSTARLLTRNPALDEDELVHVMSGMGLSALQSLAAAKRSTSNMQPQTAVTVILIDRYNKGKRGADRIK